MASRNAYNFYKELSKKIGDFLKDKTNGNKNLIAMSCVRNKEFVNTLRKFKTTFKKELHKYCLPFGVQIEALFL